MYLIWDLCTKQNHVWKKQTAILLFGFTTIFNLNRLRNRLLRSHFVCRTPSVWWEQAAGCAALWLVNCVSNHFTARQIASHLHRGFICKRASRTNNSNQSGTLTPCRSPFPVSCEAERGSRGAHAQPNHHLIFFFSFFLKGKKELNVYFVVEKNTPLQSLHRNKIITVTESCSLTVTICQRRLWWHIKTFLNRLSEYIWPVLSIFILLTETALVFVVVEGFFFWNCASTLTFNRR